VTFESWSNPKHWRLIEQSRQAFGPGLLTGFVGEKVLPYLDLDVREAAPLAVFDDPVVAEGVRGVRFIVADHERRIAPERCEESRGYPDVPVIEDAGMPRSGDAAERRCEAVHEDQRRYRLFALRNTKPAKPALVRAPEFDGPGIEVEVREVSRDALAGFVTAVPPPLGIGSVLLQDGCEVRGFICESHALSDAEDITRYGGWRAFLQSRR
jgi:hypothetical protein